MTVEKVPKRKKAADTAASESFSVMLDVKRALLQTAVIHGPGAITILESAEDAAADIIWEALKKAERRGARPPEKEAVVNADLRAYIVDAEQWRIVQKDRTTVVDADSEAEALSTFYRHHPTWTETILRIEKVGVSKPSDTNSDWATDEQGTEHRPTRWPTPRVFQPYGIEVRQGREATLQPRLLGAKRWDVVEVYVRMPEGYRERLKPKLMEAAERILREEGLL